MPEIQWTYSIPGPLLTSYDMPEIQGTYSIPGPIVASYDMSGIHVTCSTAKTRCEVHEYHRISLISLSVIVAHLNTNLNEGSLHGNRAKYGKYRFFLLSVQRAPLKELSA